jgi:tetratricopeptide (TPR) repeat protein
MSARIIAKASQIIESLTSLYNSDYRLRDRIYEALKTRVDQTQEAHYSFQLAICYELGFGCFRSEQKARDMLRYSGVTFATLCDTVAQAGTQAPDRVEYSGSVSGRLRQLGNLPTMSYYDYYVSHGILKDAFVALEKDHNCLQTVLGQEASLSIFIKEILALMYFSEGAWSKAGDMLKEIVTVSAKGSGETNASTLTSQSHLVEVFLAQEQWSNAIELGRVIATKWEATVGRQHSKTLAAKSQVAVALRHLETWPEVAAIEAEILQIRQTILGPDHQATTAAKAQLVWAYRQAGQNDQYKVLAEKLLGTSTEDCDLVDAIPDDTTIESAWSHSTPDRSDLADQTEEIIFHQNLQNFGPTDARTLWAQQNLAIMYHIKGQHDNAARLLTTVLEHQTKVYGAKNQRVLRTANILLSVRVAQREYDLASSDGTGLLLLHQREFGPRHTATLSIMATLALAYTGQGRMEESVALLLDILRLAHDDYGPSHSVILKTKMHLAQAYRRQRCFDQAEELYREVWLLREELFGIEHHPTLRSLQGLISVYRATKRIEEHKDLFARYLEAKGKTCGLRSLKVFERQRLGSIFLERKHYSDAEKVWRHHLEHLETTQGVEGPRTVTARNNLAISLMHLNRLEEAKDLLAHVLTSWTGTKGYENPATMTAMYNLAWVLRLLGSNETSLQMMSRCAELRREYLGEDHPDHKESIGSIEDWHCS